MSRQLRDLAEDAAKIAFIAFVMWGLLHCLKGV